MFTRFVVSTLVLTPLMCGVGLFSFAVAVEQPDVAWAPVAGIAALALLWPALLIDGLAMALRGKGLGQHMTELFLVGAWVNATLLALAVLAIRRAASAIRKRQE